MANITRKGKDHLKSTHPFPVLLQAADYRLHCRGTKENKLIVINRNMSDKLHEMLSAKSQQISKHMGWIRLDG